MTKEGGPRTTRTWRSHRRDLCGDLLRSEGAKLLGGATQLANHTLKSLTTGIPFRRLQVGQDQAQPIGVLRLNSRFAPSAIESFQTLVRKAPDHERVVTYTVTWCNGINELKLSVEGSTAVRL